jgi:hypothetical protein
LRSGVLCGTGVMFLALVAQAGQVHTESVTFEELVRDASAIVVVKPARGKPRTEASVDITPAGKPADPRRYPPYQFVIHEYEVVKVLKGDGLRPGKRLRVYPADHDTALSVHRNYHVKGISKHWISRGYEPRQPPPGTSTESIVVFLGRSGARWSFAAEGAVESSALADEISAALAKPKN